MSGEKTEAPTLKKRRDARDKGDVVDVRDATGALVLIAGALWVVMMGGRTATSLGDAMRAGLEARIALTPVIMPVAALFALTLIAAVGGRALGGLGWSAKALRPQAARVSPMAGAKRIASPRGLTEFAKALAKVLVMAGAAWAASGPLLATMRHGAAPGDAMETGGRVLMAVIVAFAAIAAIDLPVQHRLRTRRLRMSMQEVRDEAKETEQSPELRRHVAARRRALADGSARAAMTDARVVLVNPTHFAVALAYDPDTDAAPVVVARARGEAAMSLRLLAESAAVPVLSQPPLARALYFTTRPGAAIDPRLYRAVAIVMAFVFGIAAGRVGGALEELAVPDACRFDPDGRVA